MVFGRRRLSIRYIKVGFSESVPTRAHSAFWLQIYRINTSGCLSPLANQPFQAAGKMMEECNGDDVWTDSEMDQWAGPTGVTPLHVVAQNGGCKVLASRRRRRSGGLEVWSPGAENVSAPAPLSPPVNRGSASCPTCQRYSGVVSGYPRTWPLWGSLSAFRTLFLGQPSSMTSSPGLQGCDDS